MKRARRRPYVSLIPRKPGSTYLHWNLGRALASDPSTVEIQVGFFDRSDSNRFVLLRRIGPPQVTGGTFLHIGEEANHSPLVAMIVQKSSLPPSPHRIVPGDIYATSRPVQVVRTHPSSDPPSFVVVTYQYPLPLQIEPLEAEWNEAVSQFKVSGSAIEAICSSPTSSSHRCP